MKLLTSKNIATAFGITFIVAGLIGFVPNPLVSGNGVFAVNLMHNVVHILTGGLFLFGAIMSEQFARRITKIIGVAYVGVAVIGFLTTGNMLLGLIHINEADRWLHLVLAVVILAAGFGWPDRQTSRISGA